MTITIKQDIEVEVSDLKKACSVDDLAAIFTEVANHFECPQNNNYAARRRVIRAINDGLSECAKRMLAEVVALEFANCTLPQSL